MRLKTSLERHLLLKLSSESIPEKIALHSNNLRIDPRINNRRMDDAVIGAVFVVCRGFRDNGDGMETHNLSSVTYHQGKYHYYSLFWSRSKFI